MSDTGDDDAELNGVGSDAVLAGLVLASMCVSLAVFFAAWVFRHRNAPAVRAMQPIFLIMLCFGTMLENLAIIFKGRDDTNSNDANNACMADVWLTSMGDTFIYSALFSKLWRVNQIFTAAATFRRKVVTVKRALLPFAIFLTLNLIFLTTTSIVDPLVWVRIPIDGDPNNTIGHCAYSGTVGEVMTALLDLVNFVALIFMCVQAYRARDIQSEFSDARGVALALFSWLQIMIIANPMFAMMHAEDTEQRYVLSVLVATTQTLSLLLFIFGPLVSHQRKIRRGLASNRIAVARREEFVDGILERTAGADALSLELKGTRSRITELESHGDAFQSLSGVLSEHPDDGGCIQVVEDADTLESRSIQVDQ